MLGLYAIHYGLAEGGRRALLAEYTPAAVRGRAYGIQLAVEGIAVLANVLFGLAYDRFGATAAFSAAGVTARFWRRSLSLYLSRRPPPRPI